MTGVELIAAERQRQIEAEGWTPKHDDQHKGFELTRGAECYAWAARYAWAEGHAPTYVPNDWRWANFWWKPSRDPIKNLAKAGALIAAEIDRLQRKAETEATP